MEKAIQQHFFHHRKENFIENSGCHWCQLRSFPTHLDAPVSVVNDVDSEILPKNFRFINKSVLGEDVEPAEASFRSGCTCTTDLDCQFTGCHCLAELAEEEELEDEEVLIIRDNDANDDDFNGEAEIDDVGMKMQMRAPRSKTNGIVTKPSAAPLPPPIKAYAYHTHGTKAGLLRSKLHSSALPLYECHAGCSCTLKCPNRVVERGRTMPLQIFRTEDRGWGVRTLEPIMKGQFVDRYCGEIITSAEADRRRAGSAFSKHKDVYLFALDKFTDPSSLDPRLRGPPLEVDGEFMSGPTRFINHSCDPNLRIFARVGDHADKHLHDLAFFAIKDIEKGKELTFDYVDGVSPEDQDPDGAIEDMTPCLCGSSRCRKYLW